MSSTTKSTPTTFEAPEGFVDLLPKEQIKVVGAWYAANPTATIEAKGIGEGGLPAYLRRDTGKRADINRMMVTGGTIRAFIPQAVKLGGGWMDLVAGLTGGYSRSAAGYGNPAFKLVAKS
jgi:hypothetical protein